MFFFLLSAIMKKNGGLAKFPKIRKIAFLILEKFYNSEINLCAKDNKFLLCKEKRILARFLLNYVVKRFCVQAFYSVRGANL